MKILRGTIGLALLAVCAGPALAEDSIHSAFNYSLGAPATAQPFAAAPQGIHTAFGYDLGAPAPFKVAPQSVQTAFNYNLGDDESGDAASNGGSGSGCADEPACGCEPDCGCEPSCGCDSCDGGGWGCCMCGDCSLDDPWTLQDYINPCCTTKYGGWLAIGYYNDNERLSFEPNDLLSFRDNPDHLNVDQAWFWVERKAEADCCGFDWGYRYDILYGVDAQKTQAFGNENPIWDVTFDHGSYGWAMPQAYGELAYGDWTFQVGHFYTLIGHEVVQAPNSFFYSHSYQMFNSEPFTHTGVLGEYQATEKTSLHAGWVLGWDTGFDQWKGGNAFHGGFTHNASDNIEIAYMLTAGNFGFRSNNTDGYSHSFYIDVTMAEDWNYVLHTDYVTSGGYNGTVLDNEDIGIANYLFYSINDCWHLGGRVEWWKSNSVTGEATSFYEVTGGINYYPQANVCFRPEIRYNWTPAEESVNPDFNQAVFAIDGVFTF